MNLYLGSWGMEACGRVCHMPPHPTTCPHLCHISPSMVGLTPTRHTGTPCQMPPHPGTTPATFPHMVPPHPRGMWQGVGACGRPGSKYPWGHVPPQGCHVPLAGGHAYPATAPTYHMGTCGRHVRTSMP